MRRSSVVNMMSSTAPEVRPVVLDSVSLVRQANGQVWLSLVAGGEEIHDEKFNGWGIALDLTPRLARDWAYGVILEHYGSR